MTTSKLPDAGLWGPQRIVCMTEETTEWLYLLGQEHRIVGISGYTVRPRRARDEKPKISAFLSAKIDAILALEPDCVLGFSDLQADIAADLIKRGVQVSIFNQRSIGEIFSVLQQIAGMVGCQWCYAAAVCMCCVCLVCFVGISAYFHCCTNERRPATRAGVCPPLQRTAS